MRRRRALAGVSASKASAFMKDDDDSERTREQALVRARDLPRGRCRRRPRAPPPLAASDTSAIDDGTRCRRLRHRR